MLLFCIFPIELKAVQRQRILLRERCKQACYLDVSSKLVPQIKLVFRNLQVPHFVVFS